MEFDRRLLEKMSPALAEALEAADEEDVLTAILDLGLSEASNNPELLPKDFTSRRAWREALIARQVARNEALNDGTIQSLRYLSLQISAQRILQSAIVTGQAKGIVSAV